MKEQFLVEKLLMNHFEWTRLTLKEKIKELAGYYFALIRSKLSKEDVLRITSKAGLASVKARRELKKASEAGMINK